MQTNSFTVRSKQIFKRESSIRKFSREGNFSFRFKTYCFFRFQTVVERSTLTFFRPVFFDCVISILSLAQIVSIHILIIKCMQTSIKHLSKPWSRIHQIFPSLTKTFQSYRWSTLQKTYNSVPRSIYNYIKNYGLLSSHYSKFIT